MPVYADRDALRNRPASDAWVDIDDVEFFSLGGNDRIADGEEPVPTAWPDPITEGPESLHASHRLLPMSRRVVPTTPKERLVVLNGEALWEADGARVTLKRMQYIDVPAGGGILTNAMMPGQEGHRAQVHVARIAGHWKDAIRTAIFSFGPGRPCDYHYHDGDEYWLVFRGHFTLHYRGEDVEFRPGMILAAGMGEEHGVIDPQEVFEGIGFATQLEGECRDGHLWRTVHGDPVATRG